MEVHTGSSSVFEHVPRSAVSTSCDWNLQQPYHDGSSHQQHHIQIRQQNPQAIEWRKDFDDTDVGNTHIPTDFDMLDRHAAGPGPFQSQLLHNFERLAAVDPVWKTSITSYSSPPSLRMPPGQQQHQLWPATSVLPDTFPVSVSEHEAWGSFQKGTTTTATPTSNPVELTSFQPSQSHRFAGGPCSMLSQGSPLNHDFTDITDMNVSNDPNPSDPCYAQLLYRCLKEAPDHMLSLRELYDWVKQHSHRARDARSRGWQNSVRHNLSMNAAFERVPQFQIDGIKKSSLWRLTPRALSKGIISTTRYRKDPKHKAVFLSSPILKRQVSGTRGGQVVKNATRRQQTLRAAGPVPPLSVGHVHLNSERKFDLDFLGGPPTPLYARPQQHMQSPLSPLNPYLLDHDNGHTIPISTTHTPQQLQNTYDVQSKETLSNFNSGNIGFANGGVFGNHDDFAPDTPSLATEASFISEEGIHSHLLDKASGEALNSATDC